MTHWIHNDANAGIGREQPHGGAPALAHAMAHSPDDPAAAGFVLAIDPETGWMDVIDSSTYRAISAFEMMQVPDVGSEFDVVREPSDSPRM